MNTAHWHLLLNHFPLIGTAIGMLILIAGFLLKNNSTIKQTGLSVLIFSALTAVPAFLTGEGAEEIVQNLPGVNENAIEIHEDKASSFLIMVILLGVLSLLTFIANWLQSKASFILYVLVLTTGLGTAIFAKQVGTSGGEIRHTEIHGGTTDQKISTPESNEEDGYDED